MHFDFNPYFVVQDRTVHEMIAQGFPTTLCYGMGSFAVAVVFGVTLGVLAAIFRNASLDDRAVGIPICAQALPDFVLAPILVLIFTLWLGCSPGGGW